MKVISSSNLKELHSLNTIEIILGSNVSHLYDSQYYPKIKLFIKIIFIFT